MDQQLRTLHPPHDYRFDDEFFFALCQANETLRLERDASGNILFMPPTGTETGRYNLELAIELGIWNRQKQLGVTFDSSTGFTLPNSAVRSPDASWVAKERWDALTERERQGFAPICPDFVIEVRSKSDDLKAKMKEYRDNGTRLGWLIDRAGQQVFIYRENGSIEIKQGSSVTLSGEDVLPDFSISLPL
ncbi:Uma2 family endonuclease [Spirosoma oryzae]|uniref:Uma2 family endonuclease n=1 Tax=Spirosoma oryzae TaxID=1469603 RepID=A0A2T0T0N6_9BACT|nr:Uma2 family endonuclease [Spirosoma oryzae]PRY39173.1 Uma2 family endonuclease [Spirosoma oryzae]